MLEKMVNNKKTALLMILAVFLVVFDRLFKALAVNGFFDRPVRIFDGWFSLQFSPNRYIAFSLPLSGVFLEIFIIIIIVFLLSCFLVFLRKRRYDVAFPLTFIILGAISNMLDRARFGYVVDYFNLKWFTVFNLADMMIVGGVIIILIFYYVGSGTNKTK